MFKIKLNETGRSMVEMLGVLAIIGVLSVAGVATYQYALTAYQAGKVQDVLGKAKTLAQTDSRASHALEVNRFIKSALSEYTPDDKKSMVKLVDGNYQVTAFKVTHKICEKLLQKESLLSDMGISILTKTCGNKDTKTSMVFSFDATPTFESGSHFGGGSGSGNSGSGSSDLPDIDNPNIEPQSCPDKMVWRQKEDGTYGCVCRHEYEFGDNCERCYPPKEWFEDETTCRCPDMTPVWHNEECVECIDDSTCQIPNLVCDTSNNTCKSCPDERPFYNVNSTNPDKCEKCPDATPVFAVNTNECIACPSSAPYWNGKECSPNECESNEDCHKIYKDTNYFCSKGANICSSEAFKGARCKKALYHTFTINGVNFYWTKDALGDNSKDWEAAVNFCLALGKKMVSITEDLGCSKTVAYNNFETSCSGDENSVYKQIRTKIAALGYTSAPWVSYYPWSNETTYTCERGCIWMDRNRINTSQNFDDHGGTHYALCRDWGPMCFAPYTREGDKCVCPTGTYDTGTTCATCTAPYIINATQTGCTCPTGSHDNGTTCITCPEGSTWNDEHKACAVTVSIESGTKEYITDYAWYSLSKEGWLDVVFPENITTGKWQLVGTNEKANLSCGVQIIGCSLWDSHFSLTSNTFDLTNNTVSGIEPVEKSQLECGVAPDGMKHGQHLDVEMRKPNAYTIQVLMHVNSHINYASPFYATPTVSSATAQAILVQ